MYKVKYNRKEYREEYLNSNEWKTLRSKILSTGCKCQCCNDQDAIDVHHMVYRNIVDVKVSDLVPVCRECHNLLHKAIRDGYISQRVQDLDIIKQLTYNIYNDEEYKVYHKWLYSKHHLSDIEIKQIKNGRSFIIKRISGILKRHVWYDILHEIKFTGRQIEKIRKVIKTSNYRYMRSSRKQFKFGSSKSQRVGMI